MLLQVYSPKTAIVALLLLHLPLFSSTPHRRLLHHPFFPSSPSPSPSPSPLPHPLPHPKFPFSSSSTSSSSSYAPTTATTDAENPFFPSYPSPPPPPPPPPTTSFPTFPANISSLALPSSASSASHSPLSHKLLIILVLLSVLTLSLVISLAVLLRRKSLRDSPSQSTVPSPSPPPKHAANPSSEFLYLGNTVTSSREFQGSAIGGPSSSSEIYLKLCGDSGSPELNPLPPLPKKNSHVSFEENFEDEREAKGEDDDFFFSPRTSSHRVFGDDDFDNYGFKSSVSSPERCLSDTQNSPARDSDVSVEIQTLAAKTEGFFAPAAPPPPPPPGRAGPPPHVPPSGRVVFKSCGNLGEIGERNEEIGKTKLKALHWDKVRASSDRVMVWDQMMPGSFQLNEEMIETLFKANGPSMTAKDGIRRSILPLLTEEYRVLDPKKSQNIAILLRALGVTEKEVCEALLEGNADTLGTELLESLLKMAPTKEEERKLKEYNDVESPLKLGPAEKFLKAVLDNVPFAFKRVEALLYMATFDSELEYLRKSFETLEAACLELRNSRMFLKLLEAVLKTGNRMNVGTNRGDAEAFKLDTLLKLIDIKGTDGKTTLLHFVVQEIIKSEGDRLTHTNHLNHLTAGNPNTTQPVVVHDYIESRKRGLEIVAGLGGELINVKKAAAMDSDALSMDVATLARGTMRIHEVVHLNGETEDNRRFLESMNGFLKKAEEEIVRIRSQESSVFTRVRELTEYFHGNLAKEEAHPLRIFMVVRDFLCVLDQVCKDVGKINDRTFISSGRPSQKPVNPMRAPPFPELSRGMQGESSSDGET